MEKIIPVQDEKNINFMKVAFHTLGCKVNFSETSTISRKFTSSHYQVVSFTSFADLYVINTCSVTENADKELSVLVKNALKKNPNAFIAAIGCYAQLKPHEIASLDGVDLVLGASDYKELKFYASEIINNRDKIITKLLTRYNEIFPRINHINDKISKDIIRKVLRKY